MKKSEKSALNRRLMVIYVGYFLLLAVSFVSSTMPLMSVGYKSGAALAHLEEQDQKCYMVAVRPIPMANPDLSALKEVEHGYLSMNPYEGFVAVALDPNSAPESLIEKMDRNAMTIFAVNLVILLCWVVIYVLIALIINSMRCSIRDQHPLPQRNILYMRLIGGFILLNVFCEWLTLHLGHQMVALSYGSMPEGFEQVIPSYIIAILALLVILSAEIFSVGSKLSEEQKLTI